LVHAMTVRRPVVAFHLPGSTALLLTLALLPGIASANDCVIAEAPKAAAVPVKPRPVVRAPVRRPPPKTDVDALATPKAQPVAQAKPRQATRPRAVVHRKRPAATANLAAAEQAKKPATRSGTACAPTADPQAAVKAPLVDVARFTPIDPPTRLLSESNAVQTPLEGIRTGLPGMFFVRARGIGGNRDRCVIFRNEIFFQEISFHLVATDVRQHDAVDFHARRKGLTTLLFHFPTERRILNDILLGVRDVVFGKDEGLAARISREGDDPTHQTVHCWLVFANRITKQVDSLRAKSAGKGHLINNNTLETLGVIDGRIKEAINLTNKVWINHAHLSF
jgi:hypothetical protein